MQKRQHNVTPPRTSAGCHDPPGPGGGGARTEGVNITYTLQLPCFCHMFYNELEKGKNKKIFEKDKFGGSMLFKLVTGGL